MINVNVGIIGLGYWGPNLIRNFFSTKGCKLVAISDLEIAKLEKFKTLYPGLETYQDANSLIKNENIDAIVIATPVFSHFNLAKLALEHNKHVLIEKPMTSSVQEAETLIELAAKKNKILMVDHTFLYTGAVQKIKELIDQDVIGKLKYVDSTRINLGLFQPDINVLWDLAPHDISILSYICNEQPVAVHANGICHTNNGIENIAYLTLKYQTNLIAHFNCSWTSPVKIRKFLIGGDKKMIVYDDMEPTEKVKLYDTGFDYKNEEDRRRILVDYRVGDIFVPKLSTTEALAGITNDFVMSVTGQKSPVSDAQLGLKVVKILEAAQKSIKLNGKEIPV
ncbi:MAG: Gfo/Idh/MocA family oxidoreductase [Bacteroidales bacterium]